jgi:DNA-binding NtrC family response regulator
MHDMAVHVLFVGPFDTGQFQLASIFSHSKWRLYQAGNYDEAVHCLRMHSPPVIICDTEVSGQCWRRLLEAVRDSEDCPQPRIIVSSRAADNHLWSEVLNLGGYDVLERPFDKSEVVWVISHAWLDWRSENERGSSHPAREVASRAGA